MTNQPSGVIGVPRLTIVGGGGMLGTVDCPYAGANAPATVAIASNTTLASFPMHPLRTGEGILHGHWSCTMPVRFKDLREKPPNVAVSPLYQSACGTRRGHAGPRVICADPHRPTRQSWLAKADASLPARRPAAAGPTDR